MASDSADINIRPSPDQELVNIARYTARYRIESNEAYDTARYCLMDSLGCALLALRFHECTKLLGPIIPETVVPNGARVPGTRFALDPVKAAFEMLGMIDVNRRAYYSWQGYVFDSMVAGLDGTVYMGQAERKSKLYLFYPN